jgi:hypothetical protein
MKNKNKLDDDVFAASIGASPADEDDEAFAASIGAVPVDDDEAFADSIGAVPVTEDRPDYLEPPSPEEVRFSGITVPEEVLDKISKYRGIPKEDIEGWVAFLGGYRPQVEFASGQYWLDAAKETGHMLEDIATSGVGTKGAIKLAKQFKQNPDKWEAAIDDIREFVDARKSGGRTAFEMGTGLVAGIGKGVGVLSKAYKVLDKPTAVVAEKITKGLEKTGLNKYAVPVLSGAGTGATFGVASGLGKSRGDEDWSSTLASSAESALYGAAFGGALGTLAGALQLRADRMADFDASNTFKDVQKAAELDPSKINLSDSYKRTGAFIQKEAAGDFMPGEEQLQKTTEAILNQKAYESAKKQMASELRRLKNSGLDAAEYDVRENEILNDAFLSIKNKMQTDPATSAKIQKQAEKAAYLANMTDHLAKNKDQLDALIETTGLAAKTKPELITPQQVLEAYEGLRNEFSGYLNTGSIGVKGKRKDLIDAFYQQIGDNRMVESFDDFSRLKSTSQIKASPATKIEQKEMQQEADSWIERAGRWLPSSTSLFAEVPQRLNLPVDVWKSQFSRGINDRRKRMGSYETEVNNLRDLAGEALLTPKRFQEISEKLQGRDINSLPTSLSPAEMDFFKKYHEVLSKAHNEATSLGFKGERLKGIDANIPKEDVFYSPRMKLGQPEAFAAFMNKTSELETAGVELASGKALNLKDTKVLDYVTGLEILSGERLFKNTKEGKQLLTDKYDALFSNFKTSPRNFFKQSANRTRIQSSAAMERTGDIPEFLLEKDPVILLGRYTDNLFKFVETEPLINRLNYALSVAKIKKDKVSEDILKTSLSTLNAARADSIADKVGTEVAYQKAKVLSALKDPNATSAQRASAVALDSLGRTANFLGNQMYKNLLSSLPSAINNGITTSFIGTTASEFGPEIGTRIFTRAVGNFLKDLATKDPTIMNKLSKWKDLPYDQRLEFLSALEDGIQKSDKFSKLIASGKVKVDKLTDLGMIMFQQGEVFNRYMANSMGEQAASMYLNNPKDGRLQVFLKNLSPGIKQLLQKKDIKPEQVSELFRNYLVDKTVFQYDRMNAAQFAKDIGSIFVPFTRFPAEAFGDIRWTIKRGDLSKKQKAEYLASKYTSPIVIAALLNNISFGSYQGPGKVEEDESQGEQLGRFLVRSQGFMSSPILPALGNVLFDDYSASPVLGVPKNLGVAGVKYLTALLPDDEYDYEKEDRNKDAARKELRKAVVNLGTTFIPFANWAGHVNDAGRVIDLVKGTADRENQRTLRQKAVDWLGEDDY